MFQGRRSRLGGWKLDRARPRSGRRGGCHGPRRTLGLLTDGLGRVGGRWGNEGQTRAKKVLLTLWNKRENSQCDGADERPDHCNCLGTLVDEC
jgi:hypothetical protein